jgi:phenol hydroxylase P1 protein
MLPLRHVELGANLNNMYSTAYGYGTVLTQALLYNSMDRLGIAQYLSRIGLILDGNSGDSLVEAKQLWMEDPTWQGVRRYVEKMLVTKDWFELFLAQDVVLDTLLFNLAYVQLDERLAEMGGSDIAVLTDFMQEWNKDNSRWVDSVIKIAAAESDENKALKNKWLAEWTERAITDLGPLAACMAGDDALAKAREVLEKRLAKAKLSL